MAKEESGLLLYHVLLTACAFGNEMSAAFQHIFPVLFLQFLGVPVALVSSFGALSGTSSIILLPAIGRFTGKSSNPLRRKLMTMVFQLLFFLSAMGLIILCGILKIKSSEASIPSNKQFTWQNLSRSQRIVTTIEPKIKNTSLSISADSNPFVLDDTDYSSISNIPVRAYIAILAVAMHDLGVTLCHSIGRIFALECVTTKHHRNVLMLCTTTGAIAGMAFAFMCTFDLPTMLGSWFNYDGTAVLVVFLPAFMAILITICFICSITTGLTLSRRRPDYSVLPNEMEKEAGSETLNEKEPLLHKLGDSLRSLTLEKSYILGKPTESEEPQRSIIETGFSQTNVDSNQYQKAATLPNHESIKKDDKGSEIDANHKSRWAIHKRFVILFVAMFFEAGTMDCIQVFMPNAVTRDIYHGDPTALPGTEARVNYELGLRRAATGSLIMFASYSVASLFCQKIVQFMGEDRLFLAIQVTFISAVLSVLIARTEVTFFLTMAANGLIRLGVITIMFLKTNAVIVETDISPGTAMATIMMCVPIHYLVVSIITGPLMDATGNVWVPIIYAMASSCLALITYSAMFFVKR